jgi:CubicO group peptidase (beta-lactamase class C family)
VSRAGTSRSPSRSLYDCDKSTALLAAQAPWWEPGTASGYHMLTYGHLIGEVIRRITGQRLGEFFAAHIAGPLGADFHIGLPPSEFHRVANVVPAPAPSDPPPLDPNSVAFKTWTNPAMSAETTWTEGWRRADVGAGNGHGNARSLARLHSNFRGVARRRRLSPQAPAKRSSSGVQSPG